VIVRTADDKKALELALIENIQREDLNAIDLAMAFHRMAAELGLSHEQMTLVSSNKLSPGHARALLKFDSEEMQREVAERCVAEGWSVRQIENYTRQLPKTHGPKAEKKDEAKLDPNVKAAIDELSGVLGTKVKLVERSGDRGHIEIEYYSSDDLTRIYELIVGAPSQS
jgi:ParB family chromosome partitioning protein